MLIAKKTVKTITIVRRPKAHEKKDYENERVIPKERKEIFRWI